MNIFKRLFCKHKNTYEKWDYNRDNFMYNEFLDVVQIVRDKQIICKDCGKIMDTPYCSFVTTDSIYKEEKEDWLKNNKQTE